MKPLRIALLTFIALTGCQSGDNLPTIRYGEESCAYCRMIINEAPFAAAFENEAGEMKKYDDIGCMALAQADEKTKRVWVSDYVNPGKWLNAEDAFYVYSKDLKTPMGDGILAVDSESTAQTEAKNRSGRLLRFNELHDFVLQNRKNR
jgi:copper chaperone NosL